MHLATYLARFTGTALPMICSTAVFSKQKRSLLEMIKFVFFLML
jgi:hypothetical protein